MKKRNEDNPDNLGGLGGMLPADVLKKLTDLLEQLHQAGHTNNGSKIEFVYVASGGQHVDHVDNQNFYGYTYAKPKTRKGKDSVKTHRCRLCSVRPTTKS